MAKKTFKEEIEEELNPALQFISGAEISVPESSPKMQAPEGYKLNPLFVEKKSKRLQLIVKPSLYEALRFRALKEESSVNGLINSLLEEALKEVS